jgi:hypothetical protein
MEARLRKAAPDFEDWSLARSLSSAAAVALRDTENRDPSVGHGDRERLARLLDNAEPDSRARVVEAMDRYEADLDALGLSDSMLVAGMSRSRTFLWYLIRTFTIGLLLIPFALVGLVVNWFPMLVVWLIGRLKVADAMMATIKPIGGLVVFLFTWSAFVWWVWTNWGIGGASAAVVLLPVYLFALIALVERGVLIVRAARGFAKSRGKRGLRDTVSDHRREVVEAVAQAV